MVCVQLSYRYGYYTVDRLQFDMPWLRLLPLWGHRKLAKADEHFVYASLSTAARWQLDGVNAMQWAPMMGRSCDVPRVVNKCCQV